MCHVFLTHCCYSVLTCWAHWDLKKPGQRNKLLLKTTQGSISCITVEILLGLKPYFLVFGREPQRVTRRVNHSSCSKYCVPTKSVPRLHLFRDFLKARRGYWIALSAPLFGSGHRTAWCYSPPCAQ